MTDYLTIKHPYNEAPMMDFQLFADDLLVCAPSAVARVVNDAGFDRYMRNCEIDYRGTTYRFRTERGKGKEHRVIVSIWPTGLHFLPDELPPIPVPGCTLNTRRAPVHLWGALQRLSREASEAFRRLIEHRNHLDENAAMLEGEMAHFERYTGIKPERDEQAYFQAVFSTNVKGVSISGALDHQGNVSLNVAPVSAAVVASLIIQL